MVSQSESAEDITLQYTDTESRIASLKTEQERLLALLDKADTLENIITLEDRLTEVRYELENYESQRKVYDDLVTYSTVTITLEEVTYTVEVDDSTIFSRIKTGLEKSFRDIRNDLANFLVGFIVALPYLVIWAIIIFVIVWIIKKIIKRRKAKKAAKQEVQTQKGEDMQKEKE
jgi:large-conductance mechanosensitive channel